MSGVKGKSGGKREGAGRKNPLGAGEVVTLKIPVHKELIEAKGGEEKAKQIMLAALIVAPATF